MTDTTTHKHYRLVYDDGRSTDTPPFATRAEAERLLIAGTRIIEESAPVKTRTITLTDRPPVKIKEDEWPIIAAATGDSYGSRDYGRYEQAKTVGELDEYSLRVRQHADGRTIVYGVLDGAKAWTGTESWRGGELLPAGDDIAAAIRRVGETGGLPARVIDECIADLPAEEL